jgi:hypothetical protein
MSLRSAARQILRGPAVGEALQRFGINPQRFWLLIDLFATLSARRERMGQLGRSRIALRFLALIYAGLTGLVSLGLAAGHIGPANYLLIFLGLSALLLFSILIPEISNTLVNPVEALVLVHHPVDGATYTAASLLHIFRILLYIIPALNAIPAFVGLTLKGSGWSYPLIHLFAASVLGLIIALACCGIFGWLVRFVPAARLKSFAQTVEFMPAVLFAFFGPGRRLFANAQIPNWLAANWMLQAGIAGFLVSVAIAGIRCLSLDYLARVSSIIRSRSAARAPEPHRTHPVGGLVRRLFGGQPARAGFEFARRLMLRDWQFKRQLIGLAPSLVMFGGLLAGGWRISPFSGKFTPLHFLPHAFGFVVLGMCTALKYGSDYKAVWLFLLAPAGGFRRFGTGVFAAIWLPVIVFPHVGFFLFLAFAWGLGDAGVFIAYSLAIASLYLAFSIRLIDGVPFGKQLQVSRASFGLPLLMGFVAIAGVLVAAQYFLVFRSAVLVAVVTVAAGFGALAGTRSSSAALAAGMRHDLAVMSTESTLLYHEIE